MKKRREKRKRGKDIQESLLEKRKDFKRKKEVMERVTEEKQQGLVFALHFDSF